MYLTYTCLISGLKKNRVLAVTTNEETGVTVKIDEEPIISEIISPTRFSSQIHSISSRIISDSYNYNNRDEYSEESRLPSRNPIKTSKTKKDKKEKTHTLSKPEVYLDIAEPNYIRPEFLQDDNIEEEEESAIDFEDEQKPIFDINRDPEVSVKEELEDVDVVNPSCSTLDNITYDVEVKDEPGYILSEIPQNEYNAVSEHIEALMVKSEAHSPLIQQVAATSETKDSRRLSTRSSNSLGNSKDGGVHSSRSESCGSGGSSLAKSGLDLLWEDGEIVNLESDSENDASVNVTKHLKTSNDDSVVIIDLDSESD